MRQQYDPVRETGSGRQRRQVDSRELGRMADSLSSLERPVGHGLGARTTAMGQELALPVRPFWARITARAGAGYGWQEVWEDGAGNWADLGNGRSGDAAAGTNVAYEAMGRAVPAGERVRLHLAYDGIAFVFFWPGPSVGGSDELALTGGDVDRLDLTAAPWWQITSTGPTNILGIYPELPGTVKYVSNSGDFPLTFVDDSSSSSESGIKLPGILQQPKWTLAPCSTLALIYGKPSKKWTFLNGPPGGPNVITSTADVGGPSLHGEVTDDYSQEVITGPGYLPTDPPNVITQEPAYISQTADPLAVSTFWRGPGEFPTVIEVTAGSTEANFNIIGPAGSTSSITNVISETDATQTITAAAGQTANLFETVVGGAVQTAITAGGYLITGQDTPPAADDFANLPVGFVTFTFDATAGSTELIVTGRDETGALVTTSIAVGSSGSGAPVGASYPVLAADATLTSERTLQVTAPLTLTDAGANSTATLALTATAAALTLGGTPTLTAVPTWFKVTGTFTDFAVAATTNTVVLFSLPADGVLHTIIVNHTTAFTGGGLANYRVSVGRTASGEYTAGAGGGRVIFTAPADPPTVAPGVDVGTVALPVIRSITGAAATAVNAYVTGDAVHNLNVATQGSCDFYLLLSKVG